MARYASGAGEEPEAIRVLQDSRCAQAGHGEETPTGSSYSSSLRFTQPVTAACVTFTHSPRMTVASRTAPSGACPTTASVGPGPLRMFAFLTFTLYCFLSAGRSLSLPAVVGRRGG